MDNTSKINLILLKSFYYSKLYIFNLYIFNKLTFKTKL